MRFLRTISTAALTVALVGAPLAAMADTDTNAADQIESAVVAAADGQGGAQLDVSKEGSVFVASTDAGKVAVGDAAGTQLSLTSEDASTALVVGIPDVEGGANATATDSGALVYDNDDSAAAVTVQALEGGVRLSTVLKDASAPSEYAYPVVVPPGGAIRVDETSGAVLVTDGEDGGADGDGPLVEEVEFVQAALDGNELSGHIGLVGREDQP